MEDIFLRRNLDKLDMEYHILAYFYHWSEGDIERLPRLRREMYIEKVRRQVEAEDGTDKKPFEENGTSHLKYNGKEYRESNY